MDGVVAELSRLYVYSYNFYFFPFFSFTDTTLPFMVNPTPCQYKVRVGPAKVKHGGGTLAPQTQAAPSIWCFN